jgi:hypothetical protein
VFILCPLGFPRRQFISSSNIQTQYTIPSEHAWVTSTYGSPCAYLGVPYINNCNYAAAWEMLSFLYVPPSRCNLNATQDQFWIVLFSFVPCNRRYPKTTLLPAVPQISSNLVTLPQAHFLPLGVSCPEEISLGENAYVRAPPPLPYPSLLYPCLLLQMPCFVQLFIYLLACLFVCLFLPLVF